MKSTTSIKRRTLGAIGSLMLAVSALGFLPMSAAQAYDAKIRIFKSADGKLVLICHYNQNGGLMYCDVASR